MSGDEIQLTLPADVAFHGVAHLVLGGLAVRLDLRRILAAVCDRVRVEDRDGSQWIELTKAIHTGARDV